MINPQDDMAANMLKKLFKPANIKPISQQKNTKEEELDVPECTVHNNIESELYCNTCKKTICYICKENHNKKHALIKIGVHMNELEFKKYCQKISDSIPQMKDSNTKLIQQIMSLKE